MANPQKEDGYAPIANEILDALAQANLSPQEWKILMLVFRNTYGYHRKEWQLKKWKELEVTGILDTHIAYILRKLESKKLLNVEWKTKKLSFQKNYELWQKVTQTGNFSECEKVTQTGNFSGNENKKVTQTGNKKLPKQVTQVTQIGNFSISGNGDKALSDAGGKDATFSPKDRSKDRSKDTSSSWIYSTYNNSKNDAKIEKDEDDEKSQKIEKAKRILSSYAQYNPIPVEFLPQQLERIGSFDEKMIVEVVQVSINEHVYLPKAPKYIIRGLENYAKWYDKADGMDKKKIVYADEMLEAQAIVDAQERERINAIKARRKKNVSDSGG